MIGQDNTDFVRRCERANRTQALAARKGCVDRAFRRHILDRAKFDPEQFLDRVVARRRWLGIRRVQQTSVDETGARNHEFAAREVLHVTRLQP
jgi:hypothetical protein